MKNLKAIFLTATGVILCTIASAQITTTQNTSTPGRYDLYELTIGHNQSPYTNVWEQVSVSVIFISPTNVRYPIDGFYFNTDTWKVRFAAPETGKWTWSITFTTPTNTYNESGTFNCAASTTKGFLKLHLTNPYRIVYADDTLFNAIGIGDCIFDSDKNNNPIDQWGFDGDFRPSGHEASWDTTIDVYMNAYGANGAGFNLFRWSINNCAFNLFQNIHTTGNTYGVNEGLYGDTIVQKLRQYGFRVWLTLFSWNTPFPSTAMSQPAEEAAVNRYIKYIVARYGAYVDIWEMNNETTVTDHWINFTTAYLRSIDPFNRLISISWERPFNPDININAPHWYEKESEYISDLRTAQKIAVDKPGRKLLVYGEQGNSVQNWDSLSALRMRMRSWTAFFEEGILIFWNSSFAKDYFGGGASNIYLGPQERGYIRILQNYTALADTSVRDMIISPSNTSQVRAYGLRGTDKLLGYFHHYNSHITTTTSTFSVNVPVSGFITWIDPEKGNIILTAAIGSGTQTITTPSFMIDMAMVISSNTLTGITSHDNEQTAINIYPNPAQNTFTIALPDKNFDLLITDITGRYIFERKNISDKTQIECKDYANGIYFVQVRNGKNILNQKLIINK
ncbi:MAG: T9SS type A sorting domain-containing protein [Saprospiraceae bacterium]